MAKKKKKTEEVLKRTRTWTPPMSTSLFDMDQQAADLNYTVYLMVINGFGTQAIADRTGLTVGQVQGRICLYGLQYCRSNYRLGATKEAKARMAEITVLPPAPVRRRTANRLQHAREKKLETVLAKAHERALKTG